MFVSYFFQNIWAWLCASMLLRRFGLPLFLLIMLAFGWHVLGPKKPVADERRQAIANRAVEKALIELREKRGDIRRVAVMHFVNDPTDYLTTCLRQRISETGIFDLADTPFCEKVNNLLSCRNAGIYSIPEAVKYGKNAELEGVIIGCINDFESIKSGAVLSGQIDLINVSSGAAVATILLKEDTISPVANILNQATEFGDSVMPWYARVLCYVLLVLLLPICTIAFLRVMVSKRSNKVNAFVLLTYTTIDAVLALLLIGGFFETTGQIWLFVIALVCAFVYNVRIMSYALTLES